MRIEMSEQVLRGNFGGQSDDENQRIAERYVDIVEERLTAYCENRWPNAYVSIDFTIERAIGVGRDFEVSVETDEDDDTQAIQNDIEFEYASICDDLSRTGAIYEEVSP